MKIRISQFIDFAYGVTFTTIWRNFFSGKWRAGGDIWKRSRADVRA